MGIGLGLKQTSLPLVSKVSGAGKYAESEKLYYFTINILDKRKTLLTSGKCSMYRQAVRQKRTAAGTVWKHKHGRMPLLKVINRNTPPRRGYHRVRGLGSGGSC